MNDLKNIAQKAKDKGICASWLSRMNKASLAQLCEMYFKGDDWAMENDFPNLEVLREFKNISGEFGLFTDFKGVIPERQNIALFGTTKAKVEYTGFSVGNVIVRHDAMTRIVAKSSSFLVVNALDNAVLKIEAKDASKVYVYQFGENVRIEAVGNVTINKRK